MIVLDNLTKKFDENIIFQDLTMEFEEGLIHSLYGESGSGKSTLLNIIGLIDSKYTGKLEIDGIDFSTSSQPHRSKYIRYNINYLFQNYALINDASVEENLMLALDYVKKSKSEKSSIVDEVLDQVHLLETRKKQVYMLSGGEQQRIALARTLLKPSHIVLADEPTGNLDAYNRDIVLDHILKMKKDGKTVIIATHDPNVIAICDENHNVVRHSNH